MTARLYLPAPPSGSCGCAIAVTRVMRVAVLVIACLAACVAAASIVAPVAPQAAHAIDFAVTLDASTTGLTAEDFAVVADDRVSFTQLLTGSGTSFTLRVKLTLLAPCPTGYARSADGMYCGRAQASPGSWAAQVGSCAPATLTSVVDSAHNAFVAALVPRNQGSAWYVERPPTTVPHGFRFISLPCCWCTAGLACGTTRQRRHRRHGLTAAKLATRTGHLAMAQALPCVLRSFQVC